MKATKLLIDEGLIDCSILINIVKNAFSVAEEAIYFFEMDFAPLDQEERNQLGQISILGKRLRELIREFGPVLDEIADDIKRKK